MVRHIHGSYWDQLWDYMDYWIRTGDCEADALAKAYWWDCVEVWNFDHSWDDEKTRWSKFFVLMFPNCKCPEA